jgi:hypothetical protein
VTGGCPRRATSADNPCGTSHGDDDGVQRRGTWAVDPPGSTSRREHAGRTALCSRRATSVYTKAAARHHRPTYKGYYFAATTSSKGSKEGDESKSNPAGARPGRGSSQLESSVHLLMRLLLLLLLPAVLAVP